MAETIQLNIEKRNMDKNPRELRKEGILTGTVYGKGMESVSVQLNEREFINIYKNNQEATYEISVDGKKYSTNIANLQKNYATNDNLNVEFKVI